MKYSSGYTAELKPEAAARAAATLPGFTLVRRDAGQLDELLLHWAVLSAPSQLLRPPALLLSNAIKETQWLDTFVPLWIFFFFSPLSLNKIEKADQTGAMETQHLVCIRRNICTFYDILFFFFPRLWAPITCRYCPS